ncbi:DgyrCDS536 [Dimorphilus gyrociliatus]|uniref:DgyrCDS536 n=1 Tax=Dimorphilus gyrociliatus TaxID=2664684 RepID=A0A7I8V6G8_9ANNE|nr:DgyrCDS536 [Dimorphilus gyrociliatus]
MTIDDEQPRSDGETQEMQETEMESEIGTGTATENGKKHSPSPEEAKKALTSKEVDQQAQGKFPLNKGEEMNLLKTNGTMVEMDEEKGENGADNSRIKIVTSEKKKKQRKCLFIGIVVILVIITAALIGMLAHHYTTTYKKLRLAVLFQDNMVLQREPQRARIWGYGPSSPKNQSIFVQLKNKTGHIVQSQTTQTVKTGNEYIWSIYLEPMNKGGPYMIEVQLEGFKEEVLKIKNILFGDVWICAGDENMQYTLHKMGNEYDVLMLAKRALHLRLFSLSSLRSRVPLSDIRDVEIPWSLPTKDALFGQEPLPGQIGSHFSSLCFNFGRKLYHELNVPIGLISSTFAHSKIEEWSSTDSAKECNEDSFRNSHTSTVWNSMINPLKMQTFKGMIFYQGSKDAIESTYGPTYECLFKQFITSVKSETDASVGFIQLPGAANKYLYHYTNIRWLQTSSFGYVPNKLMSDSFMVSAIDLPAYKQSNPSFFVNTTDVLSDRLVLSVLYHSYQWQNGANLTPYPIDIQTIGKNLQITFQSNYESNPESIDAFEICCTPKNFTDPCPEFGKTGETTGGFVKWLPALLVESQAPFLKLGVDRDSCSLDKKLHGIRYAWNAQPCDFEKCAIYGESNKLPTGPFLYPNLDENQIRKRIIINRLFSNSTKGV